MQSEAVDGILSVSCKAGTTIVTTTKGLSSAEETSYSNWLSTIVSMTGELYRTITPKVVVLAPAPAAAPQTKIRRQTLFHHRRSKPRTARLRSSLTKITTNLRLLHHPQPPSMTWTQKSCGSKEVSSGTKYPPPIQGSKSEFFVKRPTTQHTRIGWYFPICTVRRPPWTLAWRFWRSSTTPHCNTTKSAACCSWAIFGTTGGRSGWIV